MKLLKRLNNLLGGKIFLLILFVGIFLIVSVLGNIGDSGYSGLQVDNYFSGSGKQGITQEIFLNDSEGNNYLLSFEDGLLVNYSEIVPPEPSGLLDELVAYYKLDETEGDFLDSASYLYNATNEGEYLGFPGKINNCVNFSGMSADYIQIPSTIPRLENFTISLWANLTNPIYDRFTFSLLENNGIRMYIDNGGNIHPSIWHGGYYESGFSGMANNTWTHLVMAYNGTYVTLYVNNTILGTVYAPTHSIRNSTDEIGNLETAGGWSGGIDEFGIWNRSLNSTEISELYNSGSGLAYPFD